MRSESIRGNQTQLAAELIRALDHGVTPLELSETLTHLAFYDGWPNAMSAASVAKGVFDKRLG